MSKHILLNDKSVSNKKALFHSTLPPTTLSTAGEKEQDWCSVPSKEINALHDKSNKNCWMYNSIVKTQRNFTIPLVLAGLGFLGLYVNWKIQTIGTEMGNPRVLYGSGKGRTHKEIRRK